MNAISLIIRASITYFGVVFAFGFLLGAIRILLLVPILGETLAVLIELPFMIAISWMVCVRTLDYFSVPEHFFKRLTIGILALALLLSAELLLAIGLFDGSLQQFLSETKTLPGALGLIGQGLFALFPILHVNISQIKQATSSS